VLDPAQNDSFTDHYLGVPFDLSEVLFIATSNFIQNIPGPLLDRMEVVDFSGYTEREKSEIAKTYLIPRQLEDSGLGQRKLTFTDDALSAVARRAIQRKTGARGLRSIMEAILLDTMFELPNLRGVEEVAINAEVVEGRARPLYVHGSEGQAATAS
jgi:ATP-dependent Lon protease